MSLLVCCCFFPLWLFLNFILVFIFIVALEVFSISTFFSFAVPGVVFLDTLEKEIKFFC